MTTGASGEDSERRGQPRVRFKWKAAIGYRDEQDLVPAVTSDVSATGVRLLASFPALPGDELLVVLSLKDRTVPVVATVIHSENVSSEVVGLRLRFSWLSEVSKDKLALLTGATDDGPHALPQAPP